MSEYETVDNIYPHLSVSVYDTGNKEIECLCCKEKSKISDFYHVYDSSTSDLGKEQKRSLIEEIPENFVDIFVEDFVIRHQYCFSLNMDDYFPINKMFYKKPNRNTYCSSCDCHVKVQDSFIALPSKTKTIAYLLCKNCADRQENVEKIIEYNFFLYGWTFVCTSFFITTEFHLNFLKTYNKTVDVSYISIIQNKEKNYFKSMDKLLLVRFSNV